jgi:hypothetical protein
MVEQQASVVTSLMERGLSPKEAQSLAVALLNRLSQKSADDPALKIAAGLIGKRA